jgi:hypothetical protein
VQLGNGQTAVMTYDAQPDPATGKINATVDFGNGQIATMQLDADPRTARGDIDATVTYGNGQTATIKVRETGASQVSSAIDNAARARTATIHVVYQTAHRAAGGYATPGRAEGAYAAPMAMGGMRSMSAAKAEIVPPRQPRIIGDRMQGDEAFIPINRSERSRSILAIAADRMGFSLVPTNGGSATRALTGVVGSAGTTSAIASGSSGQANGALLAEVRDLNANLRALRGDVDHHGDNATIAAEIRALRIQLARARTSGGAGADAQRNRTVAELGAF